MKEFTECQKDYLYGYKQHFQCTIYTGYMQRGAIDRAANAIREAGFKTKGTDDMEVTLDCPNTNSGANMQY